MSGRYPYDKRAYEGLGPDKVLGICQELSGELMHVYEPFGQAASSYEGGDPEKTAIGIRAFLSVPANIQMLCDIGDHVLDNIVTLGQVEELHIFLTAMGAPPLGDNNGEQWRRVKEELKRAHPRTYNVVAKEVNTFIKEYFEKGNYEKLGQQCPQLDIIDEGGRDLASQIAELIQERDDIIARRDGDYINETDIPRWTRVIEELSRLMAELGESMTGTIVEDTEDGEPDE